MAIRILPLSMLLVSGTLLTSCINGTRIQQDYIKIRDKCRAVAEENYDLRAPDTAADTPLGVKNQNAVLAQIFSDCMRMNGWTVASPRPSPPARPAPSAPQVNNVTNPPAPPRYIDAAPPRPANRQPINPQYQ